MTPPVYLKRPAAQPTFTQRGLAGFNYPLNTTVLEADLIRSMQGHDFFVIGKEITHIYYVIDGEGEFEVNRERFAVTPGDLVEIPPRIEFAYSGKMSLLLILTPPFSPGAVEETRANPDVV